MMQMNLPKKNLLTDIAIIVPYRNRAEHLDIFLPHMQQYLKDADFTWTITIVVQSDNLPFNRAKLLNIGAVNTPAMHYVFHDVDMLPVEVDYSPYNGVKQLAASTIQLNSYLGGVTMFSADAFRNSGGFHNDYFCRAEDNEMRFNLRRLGIPVLEKPGAFKNLPHTPNGKPFDRILWHRAMQPRDMQDQLSVLKHGSMHKVLSVNGTLTIRVEL